jgi:DNA-binding Lrp family transcriptional regulator
MPEILILDSVDTAILRELQNDARLPNKTLAGRVGVAPSTCLERTARLRRAGAITGYAATVSPATLGRGTEALLAIQFQAHSRPLVDPFLAYIRELPATRALYHLTGDDDFMIHVACADTADLQALVLRLTARAEVGRIRTHLIFQSWPGGPLLPPGPPEPPLLG